MNISWRTLTHIFVAVVGIVLMVGGILTEKYGATVVGLVVAAVAIQQWLKRTKQQPQGEDKSPEA